MNQKKLLIVLAAAVLILAVVLAVFLGKNDNDNDTADDEEINDVVAEPQEDEIVLLANWDGTWNALITYLDQEEMSTVRQAVKNIEGNKWEEKLQTDLVSIRLNGTALTVYSLPQDPSGAPAGDVLFCWSYDYAGTAEDEFGNTWYLYETGMETDYKFLILTPVEENVIRSFRLRYGDEGFTELLSLDDWMPLMVDSETTTEMLQEAFR